MHELRGKGWRVLGYFVWMLGAGIILDANAPRAGTLLMLIGAALFVTGVRQSMSRERGTPP
jgi:hypothetical protein